MTRDADGGHRRRFLDLKNKTGGIVVNISIYNFEVDKVAGAWLLTYWLHSTEADESDQCLSRAVEVVRELRER